MSLVDGWTLPFLLRMTGGECIGKRGTETEVVLDCSELTVDHCPSNEELTAASMTVDLRAVSPKTKEVVGCYAPCQKLIDDKWNNTVAKGRQANHPEVAPYCCPTPPETPEACRVGPIVKTQYLQAV